MNTAAQLALICGISLAAAWATYQFRGAPDRKPVVVACDPAKLKPAELCLETVISMGVGQFLWIDARSRAEWQANGYEGSLLWNLNPDEDPNAFAAEAAGQMFEGPSVIVYCGDESCGLSHEVAGQIRKLELGNEVFVLHGGWSALRGAGLVKDSN